MNKQPLKVLAFAAVLASGLTVVAAQASQVNDVLKAGAVAFTLAWVIRRPDLTPVALIALVHFSADILLDRPPGLWAALIVISTEILRNRAADLRALAFPFEWLLVTGTLVGLYVGYRVILTILLLQQAPLMLTLTQLTITILVYPVVVLLSYLAFGISRPAMGEVDDLGRRL